MGDLIEKAINFLQSEDFLDTAYTLLREHYELLLIVVAALFVYVLCLWTMLERLQKQGGWALLPIGRFAVLFKAVGINPWLSLLMAIPGINLIMRVVFYVYVARKFNRSYLMVPGLVVLPLPFLPIVAFGDGDCPHIRVPKQKKVHNARNKAEEKQPERKGDVLFIEIPPASGKKKEAKGRTITIDGYDETEEIRVLTMAELRHKRTQSKEKKVAQRARQRIGAETAPMPKIKYKEIKPEFSDKRADRMPEMKQGPRAINIAQQKEKAREVKGGEYEKLLRQQQAAQKKREESKPVKQIKLTMNGVARKPKDTQKKPSARKRPEGRSVKIEFKE